MKTAFDTEDYWESRCKQEKKRADDNLRLAADRATEVEQLRQRNRELAIDLERTTEDWKREMARAVDAERQLEAIRARESRIADRVAQALRDSGRASSYIDDIRQILGMTRYVPPSVSAETPPESGERHD